VGPVEVGQGRLHLEPPEGRHESVVLDPHGVVGRPEAASGEDREEATIDQVAEHPRL
jgi:hypothetical protein